MPPFRPHILRITTLAAFLGAAVALPVPAAGESLYSFVDAEGVIHVTNVPQDSRYHRLRPPRMDSRGVYRVVISGRRSTTSTAPRHRAVPYDDHIRAAAERYGVAPPLLKAVMAVESNFDPSAVSEKGATGLMQLMPATAREMYVTDVLDPAQNIDGGARYLRLLQERFGGDLEKVLAAYNAGPDAVRRSGGTIPAIPETQAYVRRVMALYDVYLRGG